MKRGFPHVVLLLCLLGFSVQAQTVIINEIMYHPSSENVLEEYIELYNPGQTSVPLGNWQFLRGISYIFPASASIPAGGFLVVAADTNVFRSKYPFVENVTGNWSGVLNNSGENIRLVNAAGQTIDEVSYADSGDWATRQRSPLDRNNRGWQWYAEHDGLGKSLELINHALPNEHGQNWTSSSVGEGTPGEVNSRVAANSAPLIVQAAHFPVVPTSNDPITISARLIDDFSSNVTVQLFYRASVASPGQFNTLSMLDNGLNDDGAPNDGLFAVRLPSRSNNTVLEYYIRASDIDGRTRTWPAPAIELDLSDIGQAANALLQVDDTVYNGTQPLYKIIMTEAERAQLAAIPGQSDNNGPDSQMNGTFISMDGTGAELRYLVGIRNRGHGSRRASPPNYRVSFRDDEPWKDVTDINLNTRSVHLQHLGSVLARRAGAVGPSVIPVQVRVNNQNLAVSGSPMFGSYALVEVVNGDWAANHFPNDDGGNVYKVIRDIFPPNFDYRGDNPDSYRNTYFKESNVSEDDWTDLINMLRIMGENSGGLLTPENIRAVIHPEQWLTHLAVMNLFNNTETGLNSGYNDDYLLYSGANDPRFHLVYWDLDSILSGNTGGSIFSATSQPGAGSGAAMSRFMRHPEFEPLYYQILFELLQDTFSEDVFNSIVDQTLGSYVSQGTIASIKSWMSGRRTFVSGVIPGGAYKPVTIISGTPRSPASGNTATLNVSGLGITHYRYSVNGGQFSSEIAVSTSINLSGLANGNQTVQVIGRNSIGIWQVEPTSVSWVINTSLPRIRLNEILAKNNSAYPVGQSFPDFIEIFNEGNAQVDISGMTLTDNTNSPAKYVFPNGTFIGSGQYLVVNANNVTTGFALNEDGEEVALFDSPANGGRLLDRVVFGRQLGDLSISRFGNSGEWALSRVTAGAANEAVPLGNTSTLKINEWLAGANNAFSDDFVEIFNPSSFPVNIGSLYFSDEPIALPQLFQIRPLTFIDANSFLTFVASGNPENIGHLNFRLSMEQGVIALLDQSLRIIDYVNYSPQSPDVSEGRAPDGSETFLRYQQPTPGSANPPPVITPDPTRQILLPFAAEWRFNQSGVALPSNWKDTTYTEIGWEEGLGLLGVSRFATPAFPEPLNTQLTFNSERQSTFYFRTDIVYLTNMDASIIEFRHIIDDGAVFYINGREVARYNMPIGTPSYSTLAFQNILDAEIQTFQLSPTNFNNGPNLIAVEVHQNATSSADVVLGLQIAAVLRNAAPVSTNVVINEFLASNFSITETNGTTPDWIELYNPASTAVDVSGMSLTDDVSIPGKLVLPGNSIIPAKSTLKVVLTNQFNLAENGGSILLFASTNRGGGLLDSISYGLQVADFSLARIPDGTANWNLGIPTGGSQNIAAALGNSANVKVNEWMADPESGPDWFELFNPNPQPVSISLHHLTDNLLIRTNHQIRNYSFLGAGANAFRQFFADELVFSGADHVNFKLSASQEAIGFYAPNGILIDAVTFGQQSTGISEGRISDGGIQIVAFASSATPNNSNYLPLTNLVINEILAHTDSPYEDAVEIYNTSASPVNISGWGLSDSADNLTKYIFPQGTIVPARGYLVVYENSFNDGSGNAFAFSSADGDQVYLSQIVSNSPTGYRAVASFGASENSISFGRYQTSAGVEFTALASPTFGIVNPSSVEQFRTGNGASNSLPKVGPIVITEIMYRPPLDGTNDNLVHEFIELHNITSLPVRLYDINHPSNTWRLRGGVDFNFPSNITIPAEGYVLLVSFDPAIDLSARSQFNARYGTNSLLIGPFIGKLDNGGEDIQLLKPDAPQPGGQVPYILVERIVYDDVAPWPTGADGSGLSLQRVSPSSFGNEPGNWVAATPTPGPAGVVIQDTDGDGMADDWEIANGFNPNNPDDAVADFDSDGASNLHEFRSGSDPRSATSRFAFVAMATQGNVFQVSFAGIAGRTYSVQSANELQNSVWVTITNIAPTVTGPVVATDVLRTVGAKFYRVITPAVP